MKSIRTRTFQALVASFAVMLAALPLQRTSAQLDDAFGRAVLPTEIPSPALPVAPTVAPGYRAPKVEPSDPGIVGAGTRFAATRQHAWQLARRGPSQSA